MKIVLSGYFGFGNIGDEAILEATIIGLRHKIPSIEITVLSSSPERTAQTYNVKAVSRFSFAKIKGAISGCDILISGGGGLIQDVTGFFTIPYYLGIMYLAKLLGKITVILGQGFGPIRNPINKLITKRILNKVDFIVVRDEKSSDDMIEMGIKKPPIHVAGDVTPILPLLDAESSKRILEAEGIGRDGKPLIGLSIRRPSKKLPKHKAEIYYKTIASVADYIIEKIGAKLVFIPFHYPADILESSKIINLMNNPVNIILREYVPIEIIGIISQMDLFIGMRLHSTIFCAMADIPMVGIVYDPKVRTFLELIDQKHIDVEDLQKESLIKLINDAWERRVETKRDLARWSKDLNTKARVNFEILFSYLKTVSVKEVLGIKFDNLRANEAVAEIEGFIKSKTPHLVVTPNPEIIISCRRDSALKDIVNNASLRLPDGVGTIWASKVLNAALKERVTGIDLGLELASLCEKKGYRIFLLGSSPGVAEGAAEYLTKKFPNIKIVGTYHGYFSATEESKLVENIKLLKPDVIFVGMGSPRQEKWAGENLPRLGAPVCMTIGGSLDVLSGRVRRAPNWLRRLGLEWLYRFVKEPWRWRRQVSLVRFVILVIFSRLFLKNRK